MINEFASKLKLPYIRDNFQQLIDEARHTKMDYDKFLLNLLEYEWQRRMQSDITRRLKEAKFPLRKYLVNFDRTKYDSAFLPNLIVELKEAISSLQISRFRQRFEKYQLVILDELGYVSFDKAGCEMLFNLLSSRNDKGSIIITTTNLNFDRWDTWSALRLVA